MYKPIDWKIPRLVHEVKCASVTCSVYGPGYQLEPYEAT